MKCLNICKMTNNVQSLRVMPGYTYCLKSRYSWLHILLISASKIPLPRNMKSRYGTVYGLAVILATLCTFVCFSLTIVCIVFFLERHRKWRQKKHGGQGDELERMLSSKKLEYTEPIELLQLDSNKAKLCERFIDKGLFYQRNDSYSSNSLNSFIV